MQAIINSFLHSPNIDRGAGEAEVIKTGMVLPWCSLHSGRDRCYLLHFTAEEMRPGEVRIKSLT